MTIGTKSILFGAHQFILHPCFVAWAWYKLYGWPWDIRLWFAFILHDLGYWGKSNMDGAEGEQHPEWAAQIMTYLFGEKWGNFCRYHSRFFAKQNGQQVSKLCYADKLATVLTPWWIYILLTTLTGEIDEYMFLAKEKYKGYSLNCESKIAFHKSMCSFLEQWVQENKCK